jgi:uncharacterized protein with FMN-binding domain
MNPKDRVTNNLVALGSAAVFTVYAAGFVRTRPAAQRFAQQAERRPAPATRIAAETPAAEPTSVDRTTTPRETAAPVAPESKPAKPTSSAKAVAATPVASSVQRAAERASDSVSAPPTIASSAPVASAPVSSPPVAAPVQPAAPAPARDSSHSAATPAAPDSTQSSDKEKTRLKDGIFFGWGTSRHGDIQAGLEIKNGRIISAFISECLTQYSCSWISALPAQVISRQSPDVDFVSGATQSTNAFYYAVADALKKAK